MMWLGKFIVGVAIGLVLVLAASYGFHHLVSR